LLRCQVRTRICPKSNYEQTRNFSPNRTLAHTAIAEATGVPIEELPRCSIEAQPVFTVGFANHGGTYARLRVSRCAALDKIDRLQVEIESKYPEWKGRKFEIYGDGIVVEALP
jgi:hypothetical protein